MTIAKNVSRLIYMTNTDRNTRTLIVSFAIAVMALIPLRFVEVGQMMEAVSSNEVQVLGAQTRESASVTLPEADVTVSQNQDAILEAPYDQIDGQAVLGASIEVPVEQDCIVQGDSAAVISSLKSDLARPGLTGAVRVDLLNQIRMVEVNTCK